MNKQQQRKLDYGIDQVTRSVGIGLLIAVPIGFILYVILHSQILTILGICAFIVAAAFVVYILPAFHTDEDLKPKL